MRIASLVPSATEMLYALGLGESVVAITHECDYPPETGAVPRLTRSVLPRARCGADRHHGEGNCGGGSGPLRPRRGAARRAGPDLIVTQAVCAVCAVSYEDVLEVAARLPSRPRVLQQDPSSLTEVLEDVVRLGEATGVEGAAHELRGELEGRLASVRGAVAGASLPRVIALEWLDPPYVGGHWVPEMISIAGGEDVAGPPGLKSPEVCWGELAGLNPDIIVVMPCGWYVDAARSQALEHWFEIEDLGAQRVFAVDAASTFSPPGPRLVDGVELLGHLIHPDLVDPPGSIGFAELRSTSVRPS